MAHATITITGHYTNPTGEDSTGLVHVAPDVPVILDAAAAVIMEGNNVVPLVAGSFALEVPDPRDVSLNPTGFGYVVTPITNHRHHTPVRFAIPVEAGDTIDMSEVTPILGPVTVPPASYASLGALLALVAEVAEQLDDIEALNTALAATNATAEALAATVADSDNALLALIEARALVTDLAAVVADLADEAATRAAIDATLDAADEAEAIARAGADAALDAAKLPNEAETGTLARAVVATNVVTAFANVVTLIPGAMIRVPPTVRPVTLRWGAAVRISTTGQGGIYLIPYDITGAPVAVGSHQMYAGPGTPVTTQFGTPRGSCELAPSPTERLIQLYAQVSREAATLLACQLTNGTTAGSETFIEAVLT